jgi:ubiquinone/menaquinone biosynthesis C-methylase UbiE
MLELGVGPGGGIMPSVLLEKQDANLIISDLSPTVLREWKKVFDNEFYPPNVCYAALDTCDLPFEDNTIDVISIGGFGNTEGDKVKAIKEIYRVLKPGGLFVVTDGFVKQDILKSFPENIQKAMLEKIAFIFEDYYETTVAAGFKKIDNTVLGEWSTKGDDSTIAEVAVEYGVELIVTWYARYCIK